MAEHHVGLRWKLEADAFTYETYNRSHDLVFKNGAQIVRTSAAPAYKGDAALADPEDMLVAALSSCHMLTFLAIASKRKLPLDSYHDAAVGYLEKNEVGRLAITRVILRPRIQWSVGVAVSDADLDTLHHQAHEGCFIANSVTTDVRVEPRR